MDSFDKIIKEKADQFEIPYNEAHWAEMDGRLNQIKAAKIRQTTLGVAAGVSLLAVAGYLIFGTPEAKDQQLSDNNSSEATEQVTDNKTTNTESNNVYTVDELSENHTTDYPNDNSANESEVTENHSEKVITENTETHTQKENNPVQQESGTAQANNTHSTPAESTSDKIAVDFIVYNNSVCPGEEVTFEAIEPDAQVSYLWNFGDGKTSRKTNPTHIYEESMDYTVSLTLIDKRTGKEYTKIHHGIVHILPQPDTYFTYLEESKRFDDNKLMYPYTIFDIKNPEKGTAYKWNFGNNETSTAANTKTIYKKSGNYVVTLVAENTHGCTSLVQKSVTIRTDLDLFAPNSFRPNSAIPENQVYIPGALLSGNIPFEMKILNATGKLIYKTSDKNEPWNGKMNNTGAMMPEGVYFWQVVYIDGHGDQHSDQGNFTLMK
ncbi:MAG: PKD domain-containing protein [Flavobacteriales bacterium]|nr:PKD domain-containing protein [Flavobacteriales bacterium]